MFKKLILILTIFMVLGAVGSASVQADTHATLRAELGYISQEGTPNVVSYAIGGDVVIIHDSTKGLTVSNYTSIVYSTKSLDVETDEFKAAKTFMITRKDLSKSIYLTMGFGGWAFISDGKNTEHMAYTLGGGWDTGLGVTVSATLEAVQIPGPNIYYVGLGFSILQL